MNFSAFDVGFDLGESVDIVTLDGVTITAECNDLAPDTGLRVAITSASDGWYAPGWVTGTSATVLTSADEVVWTTPNSPPATELASWAWYCSGLIPPRLGSSGGRERPVAGFSATEPMHRKPDGSLDRA